MPQPYNLTGLQNTENLLEVVQQTNIIADGMVGLGLLITIWFVLFIAFKNYDIKRALAGSSFITTVLAVLFRLISLVNDTAMFGCILITAISFIFLYWGGD